MNAYDEDYDVVIATLQEKRDRLWNMTQSNMNHDMFNIMDDIRLEQIDQLDKAMKLWQSREAIKEVIRISDREHDAWKEVKDAI
jgi:hypothetical protein